MEFLILCLGRPSDFLDMFLGHSSDLLIFVLASILGFLGFVFGWTLGFLSSCLWVPPRTSYLCFVFLVVFSTPPFHEARDCGSSQPRPRSFRNHEEADTIHNGQICQQESGNKRGFLGLSRPRPRNHRGTRHASVHVVFGMVFHKTSVVVSHAVETSCIIHCLLLFLQCLLLRWRQQCLGVAQTCS